MSGLLLYKGENIVIVGTKGAEKGWVITDYGPKGSINRAEVGAAQNTPRGGIVTREDIVNGTIPSKSGTVPAGVSVWSQ